MADDIRIKEAALLSHYSARMLDFASSINGNSHKIINKLEQLENKLNDMLHGIGNLESSGETKVYDLVRKYDDARDRYRLNRFNIMLLGDSDCEAKRSLVILRNHIESQRDSIKSIRLKIRAFCELTQRFEINVNDTVDRGIVVLKKHVEIVDKYKSSN